MKGDSLNTNIRQILRNVRGFYTTHDEWHGFRESEIIQYEHELFEMFRGVIGGYGFNNQPSFNQPSLYSTQGVTFNTTSDCGRHTLTLMVDEIGMTFQRLEFVSDYILNELYTNKEVYIYDLVKVVRPNPIMLNMETSYRLRSTSMDKSVWTEIESRGDIPLWGGTQRTYVGENINNDGLMYRKHDVNDLVKGSIKQHKL
jgi:hypothetical protein